MLKLPGAENVPDVLGEAGSASVTKRYAWTVFGMASLMALDFIDRQVVVATFPYLKSGGGCRTHSWARARVRCLGRVAWVPSIALWLIAGAG